MTTDAETPAAPPAALVLADGFTRVREGVLAVLDGMDERHLTWRPDPDANTVAWLLWHLTRVQDDHLAGAFGGRQVWDTDGWEERFGLPYPAGATGYGMSSSDVGRLTAPAELLAGYHEATASRTASYLSRIVPADLDRVVDERWDPPVTLAVRLVSVITDDLQHVGQAAYIRGMAERAG